MFKKKKKSLPSPKETLEKWAPSYKDGNYRCLIPYNYRQTESGFESIKGISVIGEKVVEIYEEGVRKASYPLDSFDGAYMRADSGSCRIILKRGSDRVLLACGDMKHKDRYGAYVQTLSRFFEDNEFVRPGLIRERVCPKCGRPFRPGSNTCARCGSKKKQIRWLYSMLKPLIPMLLLTMVIFVAISAVGLISPMLSEKMVDDYLKAESPDASMVLPYLAVVAALLFFTILQRFLSAVRSYMTAHIGSRAILSLRDSVFEKVQSLSLAGVNRRTVGELMQRISDDTAIIKNFLVSDLREIIENVTTFVAVGVILVINDIRHGTFLLAAVLIPAIPGVILLRIFHRRIHRMYGIQWQVTSKSSTILHDIFSGIRVVKAFGKEKDEIKKYDATIVNVRAVQKRNETFWAIFSPILNFFFCSGEFFVLYLIANNIIGGTMTLGEMTKLSAYASMIYGPLRTMAMMPRRITRTLTSLSKIYDVMEDEDVVTHAAEPLCPDVKGRVTLDDVSFGYEAGKQVLRHVSLDIKPGEMIGLVGRSGVGKSTLTNLVMRLYDVEEGEVRIDGVNIKDLAPECLRRNVGAVLQETFLFSGTIRQNIAYAKPDATGEEIIAAAKLAGAHDFIMRTVDGYDTYVGEKGCTLSGGERQRIAIARALLLDPKILILDEATSALDTETEKQIQDALQQLISGRTTIAIAHRLSTLRNATKIVVLDNKGIAEAGSHEELMRNPNGIYYGLVMAQRSMTKKSAAKASSGATL